MKLYRQKQTEIISHRQQLSSPAVAEKEPIVRRC